MKKQKWVLFMKYRVDIACWWRWYCVGRLQQRLGSDKRGDVLDVWTVLSQVFGMRRTLRACWIAVQSHSRWPTSNTRPACKVMSGFIC